MATISSGATAFTAIVLGAYGWLLADAFTIFGAAIAAAGATLLFLGAAVFAVVLIVRRFRRERWRTLLPLTIQVAASLVIVFVPLSSVTMKLDFRLHQAERERAVELLRAGALPPPNEYGLVALPLAMRHLSRGGGDIIVEDEGVLFFTVRGVVDNFSGFVYRADGMPPDPGAFGGDPLETTRMNARWFYVESN